jgi:hypothetical protein
MDNWAIPDIGQDNEPAQPSSGPHLQPQTYAPNHQRDGSDASSIYSSGNRLSTYQTYQAYQKHADRSASAASSESNHFSSTDESNRTSVVLSTEKEAERRPSQSSSLLPPGPSSSLQPGGNEKDYRVSEFYDAYYRNSQIGPAQTVEAKRPVDRQSTIMEVESPMPSPLFPKTQQPGAAF